MTNKHINLTYLGILKKKKDNMKKNIFTYFNTGMNSTPPLFKNKKANFIKVWIVVLVLLVGFGNAGWGATETLTCSAGTVVGTTMTFNTANFTIVHAKGTDANFASYTPWRVYTNNTVKITGGTGVSTITSITLKTTSTTYATAAAAGTFTVTGGGSASASTSGSDVTITITGTATSIIIDPNAQTRWNSIDIEYTAAVATPGITLADNGTQVAAANVIQGSNNQILSKFKLNVTTANATLAEADFLTSGNYQAADINGSGFKLWYNSTNDFAAASTIGSALVSTSSGSGDLLQFTSLSQVISSGATGYFWVTANIASAATAGRTISLDAIANADLTFASGNKSGSASAGGTQTIAAASSPTITIGSITGFGNQCVNTTSSEKYYNISGANLTADIVVTAPTGYQISTTSGSGFGSSVTLTQVSGTVSSTPIYVRFIPTLAQAYSGSIAHSSTGATQQDLTLSGTGTSPVDPSVNIAVTSGANPTCPGTSVTFTATPTNGGTPSYQWKKDGNNVCTNSATYTDDGSVAGNITCIMTTSLTCVNTATATSSAIALAQSVANVASPAATAGNAQVSVGWTNPSCYDEILIVAATATNSGIPTGDGTSYTANPAYTGGTALGNGYVAYKGTSSPEIITGLTNGTNYYFKLFTRKGSVWSAGVEVSATPVAGPCLSESFTSTTFPPTGWVTSNAVRSTTAADYVTSPAAASFTSSNGTLTTVAVANPASLKFYLGRSSNTTAKTLNVNISTTSQTTGFSTIATYDHSNVPVSTYNQYTIDLSAYTIYDNVWIQFEKVSSTTSPWRLDDVEIYCGTPVCTSPVISAQPSTTPETVCQNATATTLSITASPATGYQWYSNTSASNTGGTLVSGATAATYTPTTGTAGDLYYYCVVTNGSASCTATSDVSGKITTQVLPSISGTLTVCQGGTTTLTGSPAGGSWTSATPANATIEIGSGLVNGIAAGTSLITYTQGGCSNTATVTVVASTPTISGTLSVCAGATTTLTGSPTGGTWSSGTPANATINNTSGLVNGLAAGTSIMTYTTGCGSNTATVTVNALPTISGTLAVCGSTTTTLTGSPTGGTWNSGTPANATVNSSTGVVTGVATGNSVITYTVSGCSNTASVSVTAPTVSGTLTTTPGGATTLTGAPSGGSWGSADNGIATVNASGIVTGVAEGTVNITYTVSGCSKTVSVTISNGPCVDEGFAGGTTAPSGWTFTSLSGTYTSAAYYGAASPSIKLETTGQRIETPSFTNAVELSFYCFVQSGYTSSLLIEGWDGSSWLTIDNNSSLPQTDATALVTYNSTTTPALAPGFTKFRFTFTKNSGNVAFDDVKVTCSSTPYPEIGVTGNGQAIVDEDATPSTADWTDFGSITIGETFDRTFTIQNLGTGTLNLTGTPIVSLTGSDFSIVSQPSASTIAGGGILTFVVRYTPSTIGLSTGTISITNDDPSENPYNFSIQGTGLAEATAWLIDEKFDNVTSAATINLTNTAGFTTSGTGTLTSSTAGAMFNRSARSLSFLGTAGTSVTITTPTFANGDLVSFWYKQPGTSTNPLLVEQYSSAKAGWTTLATIPGGAAASKGRVYFYPINSAAITQIRFTYTRADGSGQAYLDDVRIRKAGKCNTSIKILQTLVQSCGGNEGRNESVLFKTGNVPVKVENLSVSFPNVASGGLEFSSEAAQAFTTNATYVSALNDLVELSYPGCRPVLEPPLGVIPANSYTMIFTGSSPSVTYDFKAGCANSTNYYAIFCDNTSTTGRYGNNPTVPEEDYTAIIDKSTGCYDAQYYDSGIPNTLGELAAYDEVTRVRTYKNYGCEIALPIELASFTAKCQQEIIEVEWVTASEINNKYFTLERSDDLTHWNAIARVNGAGNSNIPVAYSFNDESRKSIASATTYYRLTQTDYDGKKETFSPIAVSCDQSRSYSFNIYPNPVNDQLFCDITNEYGRSAKIEIINAYGQLVYQREHTLTEGLNHLVLDLSEIKSGMYSFKLITPDGKIVKVKSLIKL